MSTTTTTTTTAAASAASLTSSAKFMAFALAMGLAAPILYVLCDIFGLPLFTYHPATNRVELFWAPGRSGEGPAMYWYGWTATVIVVGVAMDTVNQVESQLIMRHYDGFMKKTRIRGRRG